MSEPNDAPPRNQCLASYHHPILLYGRTACPICVDGDYYPDSLSRMAGMDQYELGTAIHGLSSLRQAPFPRIDTGKVETLAVAQVFDTKAHEVVRAATLLWLCDPKPRRKGWLLWKGLWMHWPPQELDSLA